MADREEVFELLVDRFALSLSWSLGAGRCSWLRVCRLWVCLPDILRSVGRWDCRWCRCNCSKWVPGEVELMRNIVDFESERGAVGCRRGREELNPREVLVNLDVQVAVQCWVVH